MPSNPTIPDNSATVAVDLNEKRSYAGSASEENSASLTGRWADKKYDEYGTEEDKALLRKVDWK